MEFDEKDLALLRLLGEDGRMSWADLGREVELSPPAVAERVRKLEEGGAIQGYTARLDPGCLGLGILALVWVRLSDLDGQERLESWARTSGRVQECHSVTGPHDYVLKLRCRDALELERILREEVRALGGVRTTETQVVLSTVKETGRLPA